MKKMKKYAEGGVSWGSDLDKYTRRKVEEIDEPRVEKMRQQARRGEPLKYEESSVTDDLKKAGYGALNAYGVPLATVASGVANVGGAAVKKLRGGNGGQKLHYGKKSNEDDDGMKKGGEVKKYANGGSASSRADGIAQRGKTRGRIC